MPPVLQWITYTIPLRYFLVVLRSVFLKGVGLGILWPEMLAMAAIGATMVTVSVLRFHKSLE
jgi:ABC-2 type transport system permease protein